MREREGGGEGKEERVGNREINTHTEGGREKGKGRDEGVGGESILNTFWEGNKDSYLWRFGT